MDAEVFARIYETHYTRVFRYLLRRVRRRHEAEDLAADVFAAALEGLSRGRQPRHVGSWLVGIADHLASGFWRQNVAVRTRERDDESTEGRDPGFLVAEKSETAVLWRCLEALDPEHRRVLVLRIVAELPVRRVGAMMGRSDDAIRALQLRALRALRRHWKEATADEGLSDG